MAKQKPKYLATTDLIDDYEIVTPAELATKQDVLVSGTNIKTVNGTSIVGAGNITQNNLLPSQTGSAGKVLQTDGTDVSWETVTGGSGLTQPQVMARTLGC